MLPDKLINVCRQLRLNLIICGASVSICLQRGREKGRVDALNILQGIEIITAVSTASRLQLHRLESVYGGAFPLLILYRLVCPCHLQAARQTSLNHAAKWKSIYSWMDLSEMPKAYKNNGVCNISPGTPNGSSLEEEISSIRQLHSSMHSRERRGNGAMWTLTYVRRPAAKFRILQSFASLLFASPL